MFRSRYSNVLTVVLIIAIIAIIVIGIFIGIKVYKNYEDDKEKRKVIAELHDGNDNTTKNNTNDNNTVDENITEIQPIEGGNNTTQDNTQTGGNSSRPKTKFYKNYAVVGSIKIEKTKIEYPIVLDVSPGALEVAVGVMYPSNPKLNEQGNTVIIGHNYRNGMFFSNNKKLEVGDKVKITDLTGRTLTYSIYEISTLPETDAEYITRDRGNNTEISLSTCTDDGKDRLVILARAE